MYDGHGALSAGASSRLLFDYREPERSQILDYLFKPQFGASLHQLKVEIGGDSQSTDGTEPSHMHRRDDLDCNRGYEYWLLEQARARNPKILTYALSWAVPAWIGNDSYFAGTDNIAYHVQWLECVRNNHSGIGLINYLGIWNEKPWGNANWIKQLRAAMDTAGFHATELMLGDTKAVDDTILADFETDADFAAAVAGIGLHYPCLAMGNANQFLPHNYIQQRWGKKLWSSEDSSTPATWGGGGCWGQTLNQNFIRMNMTATIMWSLLWSVYDDGGPCEGAGLM